MGRIRNASGVSTWMRDKASRPRAESTSSLLISRRGPKRVERPDYDQRANQHAQDKGRKLQRRCHLGRLRTSAK